MNQCEVIKRIIESNKIDENKKVYYIQSYLLHWFTENQIKWIWENETEENKNMKAKFDNTVWDVQDYVEEVTGSRPDYTTLAELEKDFAEQEISLWNYPIDEVEHIIENELKVCLVRFTMLYGGYEYRWCELE